ncbi:hypothetical protein [Microbacterium sp. 18062]|uniref:hypothetical protein n=1 Tax=Microbacterium sp. 18062 TaxID=2681410 RepID=UPI0013599664|nr:hypothetical protein [Microbacterium sp. 18062]
MIAAVAIFAAVPSLSLTSAGWDVAWIAFAAALATMPFDVLATLVDALRPERVAILSVRLTDERRARMSGRG